LALIPYSAMLTMFTTSLNCR